MSPWPIVTQLHVMAESREDVKRRADALFEFCYSSAPAKAGFKLDRIREVT